MAHEYRRSTDEVGRWSYPAFHDALLTLTDSRYTHVRRKAHQEDGEFAKSLNALR